MSKFLFVAALSLLLLGGCGSREQASGQNGAVAAEANGQADAGASDPARPDISANGSLEPVPPPDAVSHPDGYLPPAPAEPDPTDANSSGPGAPATEDEYIRNRQGGR